MIRLLPGIQCVVAGSYRRGAETCGDVDILFAPPEVRSVIPNILENSFIPNLVSIWKINYHA